MVCVQLYENSVQMNDFIFQIYYATVRANTLDGNTTVTSDGVTILPVGTSLDGVDILDAMPCSSGKFVCACLRVCLRACACARSCVFEQ